MDYLAIGFFFSCIPPQSLVPNAFLCGLLSRTGWKMEKVKTKLAFRSLLVNLLKHLEKNPICLGMNTLYNHYIFFYSSPCSFILIFEKAAKRNICSNPRIRHLGFESWLSHRSCGLRQIPKTRFMHLWNQLMPWLPAHVKQILVDCNEITDLS